MKMYVRPSVRIVRVLSILACAGLVGMDCAGPWPYDPGSLIAAAQESPANTQGKPMQYTNALAHETSPYLLQHAHNPVNWHPWGEAALELARQQNKPIFLSVGYSTCYWCHVMERESFESEAVAAVLNEHFIAIKVDREQRPDIDEQYLLATQLMTGRGGWPNSVWLTPDGRPWMAGTYFPPDQFVTALEQLAKVWREQPDAVQRQADTLATAIKSAVSKPLQGGDAGALAGKELVARSLEQIRASFDKTHGGFGDAPKFPQHGQHRVLAHAAGSSDDPQLITMLTRTLDAMWRGGIHDHVGGGFHRYATDARWFLPHFEKMLYDNAQLMDAYAEGFRLTGQQRYRHAVEDIFSWLRREMTHPDGGFYSALDSESEGEEGKSYVWTIQELQEVLGAEDAERFARIYGFEPAGNFAEEATGKRTGGNIPYFKRSLEQIAGDEGIAVEALESELAAMREKLLVARSQRAAPHLDDKILASWNGLMISGLARAGKLLDEPRYTDAAARAADFILQEMSGDEGLLYRSLRGGKAELPGYLEDYAFLARGLLDLHDATGDERWLTEARVLADAMLQRFEDTEQGGFFFTSDEHEALLTRSKNLLGSGNLPLANGVAAETLLRLSTVADGTGDNADRYSRSAQRTLAALAGFMAQSPGAAESLLVVQMMLSDQQPAGELGKAAPLAQAEVRDRQPPLTVVASASRHRARPGQTLDVTVRVEIDAQWHLYGENPDVDFVIPSRASVADSETFEAGETEVSEAAVREDPVFGQTLHLYEETVTFRIPVTVRRGAMPGKTVLPVELRTQACNATRCLAARTQILEILITIVAGDQD